jgi:hypothetical protein
MSWPSAKSKEWIGGQFGTSLIPDKAASERDCCKRMDSSFMATTKRYGDKGHPFLMPLAHGKLS